MSDLHPINGPAGSAGTPPRTEQIPRGNPSQKEAILFAEGPCQVLAGPGSGKTFVLVERIRHLIAYHHIPPDQILVLTFSKAAAQEMRSRFQKITDSRCRDVTFGTFHSVFYHILSQSEPVPLSIIRPSEQLAVFRHLLLCHECPQKADDETLLAAAADLTAQIKSGNAGNTRSAAGLIRLFSSPEIPKRICREYNDFLRENHKIDFEDMILRCRQLLETDPRTLTYWQKRFRWILVDEFQDINPAQYAVLRLLAQQNLFTVGDDDQSIYGFRGSDPAVMQRLPEDYPGTKQILLSVNYRCSGAITEAAGRLISSNRNRFPKEISSAHPGGREVQFRAFPDEKQEYAWLCTKLLEPYPEDSGSKDSHPHTTAVIFRNHLQAGAFAAELDRRGIAFRRQKSGPDRLRLEILHDLYSYFRFAEDTRGGSGRRSDLYRIMNRPQRYLSRSAAPAEDVCLQDLQKAYAGSPHMFSIAEQFTTDLRYLTGLRPALAIRYLRRNIGYEDAVMEGKRPADRIRAVRILDGIAEAAGALRYPQELTAALEKMLQNAENDITGDKSSGTGDGNSGPDDGSTNGGTANAAGNAGDAADRTAPKISVLTMHASKGLEFDTVFLPDLNEGILPGRRVTDEAGMEEERRLLYVAMTRARTDLTLLWLSGTKDNPRRASRFLEQAFSIV